MPRTPRGVSLIKSAELIIKVRNVVTDKTYFKEEEPLTQDSALPTKYDELLELLQAKTFELAECVEEEARLVQSRLAEMKYLPTLKEHLKMELPEGPIGEMDSSMIKTTNFEAMIEQAMAGNIDKTKEGGKVMEQAKKILNIRQLWKKEAWADLANSCLVSSLPKDRILIQNEVAWASYEAFDRLWQMNVEHELDKGRMDTDAEIPEVKYEHLQKKLDELKPGNDQLPPAMFVGRPGETEGFDPHTGSPKPSAGPPRLSTKTKEMVDMVLLTIEVRKLQGFKLWAKIIAIFKPVDKEKLAQTEGKIQRRKSQVTMESIESYGKVRHHEDE